MPAKILYIAPYYSEAARRELRLTMEYSPAGMNKLMAIASIIPRDYELTLLSTGYSRRSDLGRIKRREESLTLKGRSIPVVYPGYRAVRQISFLEIAMAVFLECWHQKPDIVIFQNFRIETLAPALLAKLFGGARIICQFEDGLQVIFPPRSPRGMIFRALYHFGKRWCDGFTLVNGALMGEFPEARSVVVPIVLPENARAAYSPAKLNLKAKSVIKVAYTGSLDRERGADVFAEAARRLRGNSRLRFYISGRGPLQGEIEKAASARGNLEYAGLLDDIRYETFLLEMDIFVNPQRLAHPFARYSFASKVMRYIQLNKPIVSTAFSDISAVPAPGLFFYAHDDPGDLARALAGLAEREIVVDYRALFEKFSETRTREALRELLQRVSAARP